MAVSNRRIAILGKTGVGKSSLANTIFGEELFNVDDSFNSGTRKCQAKTKSVNGRRITLIDTPGFFDTDRSEEELKSEIVSCITKCAPGIHAFLILLKVEKVTEQEQAVVQKIDQCFSEKAFKYATVLFTHGDQLPKGLKIEDFVCKNKFMNDLLKKCGGRCHVIDNKYWSENPKNEYRSNRFQVEELLKSIEETVTENHGSCYTNEMLQAVKKGIQKEEKQIRLLPGDMSEKDIRKQAEGRVFTQLSVRLAGIGTGALLGALFGVGVMAGVVAIALKNMVEMQDITKAAGTVAKAFGAERTAAAAVAAAGGTAAAGSAIVIKASSVGAVTGGVTGYHAAEEADTPLEAAKRAADAVEKRALLVLNEANDFIEEIFHSKSQQS